MHHLQEVDDPASDGDSDHTDSEGSVDSKNTMSRECVHCKNGRIILTYIWVISVAFWVISVAFWVTSVAFCN